MDPGQKKTRVKERPVANQVRLATKQRGAVQFNLYYVSILVVLTSVMAVFGAAAYISLLNAEIFLFAFSSIMLAWCVWAFGCAYISLPMTMYLNQKYAQKRYRELDVAHSRAIQLVTQLPLRKTLDVPVMMSNLALMRLCQGNYESAEELFRQAHSYIQRDKYLKDSFAAAILLNNLGCACLRMGNLVEAELHAHKALEILALPKNKSQKVVTALPYSVIGTVHAKLGEFDTAEEHLTKSLEVYSRETVPAGTITTSLSQGKMQTFLWLSLVYLKQGNIARAQTHCDTAFSIIADDPMAMNTLTIEVLNLVANEFMNLKQFDRGERLLELAYSLCAESPNHPDARQTLNYFEKLLLLTDRQSEVADMRGWLRQVEVRALITGAF